MESTSKRADTRGRVLPLSSKLSLLLLLLSSSFSWSYDCKLFLQLSAITKPVALFSVLVRKHPRIVFWRRHNTKISTLMSEMKRYSVEKIRSDVWAADPITAPNSCAFLIKHVTSVENLDLRSDECDDEQVLIPGWMESIIIEDLRKYLIRDSSDDLFLS